MMMPSVAILAGGYATRLYPISKTMPKVMVKVAGKPFIAHQLSLLKNNGLKTVVICAGYLSKQIEDFVGDGKNFGLSISFSVDGEKLLGTGGAIKRALPLLTDVFLVMYGDSYLNINFKPVIDYFLSRDRKGLMTVLRNMNKWDRSNIVCKNGDIITYDKNAHDRRMEYIDYGLGILRKSALDEIDDKEVFDIAELYRNLIQKRQMLSFEVKKRFYEIGSQSGLAETEEYLLKLCQNKQRS